MIALHDATKELADQIVANANRALDEHIGKINENPARAQTFADAKAVETFNRLAADIRVTNPYLDMGKISDAIKEFRDDVANATLLKLEGRTVSSDPAQDDPTLSPFNNRIKQAEDRLRQKLETEAGGTGQAPQSKAKSDT